MAERILRAILSCLSIKIAKQECILRRRKVKLFICIDLQAQCSKLAEYANILRRQGIRSYIAPSVGNCDMTF
jgi:hypothetical protein